MSRPMTNIEISLMIDAEIARQRAAEAPIPDPTLLGGNPDAGLCVGCGTPLVRYPHEVPDGHLRLRSHQRCAPCAAAFKAVGR